MTITIKEGYANLEEIKTLFNEYTASLGIDLAYQNYAQELADLPGKYAHPHGRLYIAYVDKKAAGCIAMRKLDNQTCEMKRLYVRDTFRGLKLGEKLVKTVIEQAEQIGYRYMVLDTLDSMVSAQGLYKKLGFFEIPPYYDTPIAGTFFLRLTLSSDQNSTKGSAL